MSLYKYQRANWPEGVGLGNAELNIFSVFIMRQKGFIEQWHNVTEKLGVGGGEDFSKIWGHRRMQDFAGLLRGLRGRLPWEPRPQKFR